MFVAITGASFLIYDTVVTFSGPVQNAQSYDVDLGGGIMFETGSAKLDAICNQPGYVTPSTSTSIGGYKRP